MATKKGKEKSIEDYRRDIFTLKNKIKDEQQYLEELRQQHSNADIFGEQSYSFHMKIKILEYSLADIKEKIYHYSKDPFADFYEINFCAFALSKSCEIIGINKEMVFRAVDIESKGVVNWFNLTNFFKEVLRLDATLTNPILKILDPDEDTQIPQARYRQFLESFMLESEKKESEQDKEISALSEGVDRICRLMLQFQVKPASIWKESTLNIATAAGGIKKKLKQADVLDCIAVYCRCDPMKQGVVKNETIVIMLQQKLNDIRNFREGSTFKLKK